jgi:spermidine synthase
LTATRGWGGRRASIAGLMKRSPLPLWAGACFFGSGAAGLLYEVVWSKQLSYLLGNSLHAIAAVVAAFLGGLALGARLLGVPLARRGGRVGTYAKLELAVGVLGLLLLPALRAVEPLVGVLYRALGGEGMAFAVARLTLLLVLLVPPAALMGATLPVLVAAFGRSRMGPVLSRLYALNTLGAVVGSALAGFVLLPEVGLGWTTVVAAALNVAVAAVAWRARHGVIPGDASATPAVVLLDARRQRIFAVLFALSGLAALALQIAWVRLFGLVMGSSVYSFSAVLGVYLLGIAIGSALATGYRDEEISLSSFARLLLSLAMVVAFELQFIPKLPESMYWLIRESGPRWELLFAGEVVIVVALLLVPCCLLGAAFPVATRLLQRGDGGQATGFAYAVNTAGTIAGSLLAGFVLVPRWGVQGTEVAALLLALAVGLGALVLMGKRLQRFDVTLGVGAAAITGLLLLMAPAWNPALMSAGVFRPIQAARIGLSKTRSVLHSSWQERVLFYKEGLNSTVLVGTDETGTRWLRVGGKIDGGTGNDVATQVMLGAIPTSMARPGGRALVIGLGSGVTVASVLAAGAGPTEVVEIEPAVVDASRFFHDEGHNPLDDPRVRTIVGDARTHLTHGSGQYDIIVSEPSNPWMAGVNNLFTVDFYRRVRSRLSPDGVFCQWLQAYELTVPTMSTLARSFLEVFPSGHVFAIWGADLLLVGAPEGRAIDRRVLESAELRRILGQTQPGIADLLPMYYGAPLSALRTMIGDGSLDTDDRPVVEYRAPRDLVVAGQNSHADITALDRLVPFSTVPPDGKLFSAWAPEHWYQMRAQAMASLGRTDRYAALVEAARAAGLSVLADFLEERRPR